MMVVVLGLVHGADYFAAHLLLGSIVFYAFILPAGGVAAEAIEDQKARRLGRLSGLTLLTSSLWMILSVVDMAESWAPREVWAGMGGTAFGHLWCFRVGALFAFLFLVSRGLKSRFGRIFLFLLALSLPVISALTGHAAAQPEHRLLRVSLVLLHSLAVSVWTGGLFGLYRWLGSRLKLDSARPEMSHSVVQRFSHLAMGSTGVIGLSGVIMAYLAGVSLFHPWVTDYGKWALAKVLFFSFTLGAAAINQFVHLRKWDPTREIEFARSVRREVRLEVILVGCIFGFAGFLARTSM